MNRTLIILLVFLSLAGMSQKSKKALERSAAADYKSEYFGRAWTGYRALLSKDPNNKKAGVNAAFCASRLNYPKDSLRLLSANLSISPLADALYFRASLAHQDKNFAEALRLLEEYSRVPARSRGFDDAQSARLTSACRNAKEFIAKPTGAQVRNMGPAINSKYADYVPVIMPDESALYFTSRRETATHPARNGDNQFFEDVYVSYRKNGKWTQAENAGIPLNTETNDACVAISPDGQRMIVYRTAPDIVTGDLYVTRVGANDRWLPLQLMGADINSPFIETSACFSADTNEVYFSSDRPGGLGGKDLYRIKKLPDGRWSPPLNLGPTVNTAVDDDAPFMHPDGVTLYFSSQGHNAMGAYDVFKSGWDREKNVFGPAENLGYPINDVSDDIFFVVSVDGQRAYYCSSRDENMGGTDIYEIDTRFGANDLMVKTGRVLTGNNFGRALITLTNPSTGEVQGVYSSHPDSGKFILLLQAGQTYEAVIEAQGYDTVQLKLDEDYIGKNEQFKFLLTKNSAK